MTDRRFTFLQVFLTVLAIGFAIAVVARIRSFSSRTADGSATQEEASSTINGASSPAGPHRSADGTTAPGAAASSTPSSAKLTSREKLFRELLSSPAPTATAHPAGSAAPAAAPRAVPPPKPQSTIAKLLQPIKDLFGKPPVTPPAQGQQKTTPPGSGGDHPPAKDPTTDTTPPQVMSIAFDPPQVADGDSANVIVTAVDDLSGVRGISGTVTSPNGKALQGFAAAREAEGSNRYIGRVAIPKDADSGLWHVNFLNVSDNAANSATLSYAQSPVLQSAVLKVVSSHPDNTPPTLKAVWVDRRGMRAGEKNTLFAQVVDDKSGVNLVTGDFLSPSKIARIGFACRAGDNDVWTCDFTTPSCLDCGDWQLEQIQMQDKASNIGTAHIDDKLVNAVKVNILGDSCDNTPPVLQSLRLDTNSVPSTPEGSFVNVAVTVTDDMCGVGGVTAQVVGPAGGNGQYFVFAQSGSDPNMFVGRMPIPQLAGKGAWRIPWLQVMDKGNNIRAYYGSDPLLANAVVQVR